MKLIGKNLDILYNKPIFRYKLQRKVHRMSHMTRKCDSSETGFPFTAS